MFFTDHDFQKKNIKIWLEERAILKAILEIEHIFLGTMST